MNSTSRQTALDAVAEQKERVRKYDVLAMQIRELTTAVEKFNSTYHIPVETVIFTPVDKERSGFSYGAGGFYSDEVARALMPLYQNKIAELRKQQEEI